jgi:hemerythrin-like domain-containing protein
MKGRPPFCSSLDAAQAAGVQHAHTASQAPSAMESIMRIEASTPADGDAPLRQFRGAHGGILHGLERLRELPALVTAADRAREYAQATLLLFDEAVREHHADEEQELFLSVQRSCRGDDEAQRVRELVAVLVSQHRQIESLWADLRHPVARVAVGKAPGVLMFGAEVERLVHLYEAHARTEEDVFLPLADTILRRDANHMAALDIALHLRHMPPPRAYI